MSAQPPVTISVARYLGFALIILGASGLAVGYMGWKDAVTREASLVYPSAESAAKGVAPRGSVRITPTSPTRRATTAPTRQRRMVRRPTTAPRRAVAVQPVVSPVSAENKIVLTTPSRTIATMRRTMYWGGGSLVIGVILVGFSLHEKPPQRPRSGADEMLNEPLPF